MPGTDDRPTSPLPVITFGRALVPGTRATVPSPRTDLEPGDRVVVVMRRERGGRADVGTAGSVVDSHTPVFGGVILEIDGDTLVTCSGVGDRVRVAPVDAVGVVAPGLVADARARLRRYMAVRAEAGERADVTIDLAADPVAASHEVASHLQISWPEIQDILEAGDAIARLRLAIRVLDRETALLQAVLARSAS